MPDRPRQRLRQTNPVRWVTTPVGVWVPVRPEPEVPSQGPQYGDVIRNYWKICLSSKEIFREEPDWRVVETVFASGPLRFVLGLLSRAAFTLSSAAYVEMPRVQPELARLFLGQEALERIDEWRRGHPDEPGLYFLGDQQLLGAMTTTLLKAKRGRKSPPHGPPFVQIGRALAHLAGLVDPLQVDRPDFAELPADVTRRQFVEFILRNGIFYAREDYRYSISRYYDMFCRVAPTLKGHSDFVDVPAVFRRLTGLKLKTYLQFGVALLASMHAVAAKRDGPALLNLKRLRPPRHLRRAWRLFMREIATTPERFRRDHRVLLRTSKITEYNFLAVERRPVVALSKKVGCCLNIAFLERKFGPAVIYRLMEGLGEKESGRLRSFFGRVFERYVQEICTRTFSDLFVSAIFYDDNREAGDGWILYPPEAIVLEAKSGYLLLETVLSGRFEGFEKRFRETLLQGARQLSRVVDDFRNKRFLVGSLGPDQIQVIYPVVLTLRHLPLEKFLWDYICAELQTSGWLGQPGVCPLTIMTVKDLEHIEALRGGFLELIKERLHSAAWRDAPFGNFVFHKYPGGLLPNAYLVGRYRELLVGGARQIFHANLSGRGRERPDELG